MIDLSQISWQCLKGECGMFRHVGAGGSPIFRQLLEPSALPFKHTVLSKQCTGWTGFGIIAHRSAAAEGRILPPPVSSPFGICPFWSAVLGLLQCGQQHPAAGGGSRDSGWGIWHPGQSPDAPGRLPANALVGGLAWSERSCDCSRACANV